jgi:hypothetical protein
MIIRKPDHHRPFFYFVSRILRSHKVGLGVLVLGLYSGLILIVGAQAHRSGFIGNVKRLVSIERVETLRNYLKGLTAKSEHISIDIKYKNFEKLRYKREEAINKGVLISRADDYVPAQLRYRDKTVRVKLRLKGDHTDHLEGQKWSFRIKVRGDDTVWGMKRFSIQHPKTRDYVFEWLFYQIAKREGLVALRYRFVDVSINGRDLGIYALEEHFGKELIENNRRREGPICKFDESLWWAERVNFDKARTLPGMGDYHALSIDTFQTRKTLSNPVLYEGFLVAQNLLEQFRRNKLSASEVFDVTKFAKFLALSDLFGTSHPLHTNQFRFYYNPVLSLLEPIPFDINGGKKLAKLAGMFGEMDATAWDGGGRALFLSSLFKDHLFWKAYVKELERFSDSSYLDATFTELKNELSRRLNEIYSEFPSYRFSKNVLYENQEYIRQILNPPKGLHAYYHKSSENRIELKIGNIQYIPIEILDVSHGGSTTAPPENEIILDPKRGTEPIRYQVIAFTAPDGVTWSDRMLRTLKVRYRLLGSDHQRYANVFPWSDSDDRFFPNELVRRPSNLSDFDFLRIDEKTKRVFFEPGEWILTENLIIPKGYQIVAQEGLRLDLSNSAKILSYSPMAFVGGRENPIVIYSSDGTGQGIAVMMSQHASLLKYVIFDNLSNPSHEGWTLTGAVTFYESPVVISNVQFTRNRSEDALNIIRSDFEIDGSSFNGNSFDAFDSDFSTGNILDSDFFDSGNDAIDISGSVVNASYISINGARDKGLSIGESSEMTASHIEIANTNIAVASKDMSSVTIESVKISDSNIGLNAFQKKPEFGSASIRASGLSMDRVVTPYLIEAESSVTVDGERIEGK